MADVAKSSQDVVRAGLAATYHSGLSVSDTYVIANDGKVVLHFKKTGAGSCNVIIQTPGTVDTLAIADRTVVVPATTGDVFMGPFDPDEYNDAAGTLRLTCSEITGLSFAVLRVPV